MKDTSFSIRIAQKDLETIREKAKFARLSQSDYVTRCCLGKKIVIVDGAKELMTQLRAIGNNLNQLTILANLGRIQVVDLQESTAELAKIHAALRELLERKR